MSAVWEERIEAMYLVKQELMNEDFENLLSHHLPTLAATKADIRAAEEALGFDLDRDYKAFLEKADGWKGFMLHVDLFGTKQLSGSPDMDYALAVLDAIDDNVWQAVGHRKHELLPIAATPSDKDVFVMTKPASGNPGAVLWLAGEVVESYSDFTQYFMAMIDHNRALIYNL